MRMCPSNTRKTSLISFTLVFMIMVAPKYEAKRVHTMLKFWNLVRRPKDVLSMPFNTCACIITQDTPLSLFWYFFFCPRASFYVSKTWHSAEGRNTWLHEVFINWYLINKIPLDLQGTYTYFYISNSVITSISIHCRHEKLARLARLGRT